MVKNNRTAATRVVLFLASLDHQHLPVESFSRA